MRQQAFYARWDESVRMLWCRVFLLRFEGRRLFGRGERERRIRGLGRGRIGLW
jgi:hypothetical protein